MTIEIREAVAEDVDVIVGFNAALAQETEDKILDPDVLRAGVQALLDDALKGIYYVAVEADEVLGQLMITREWSDWRHGWMWWIQSVYVVEQARRRGIFRQLYHHVEALATANEEVAGIRLYVEVENERARNTYLQLGMEETSYRLMEKQT